MSFIFSDVARWGVAWGLLVDCESAAIRGCQELQVAVLSPRVPILFTYFFFLKKKIEFYAVKMRVEYETGRHLFTRPLQTTDLLASRKKDTF